MVENQSLLQKYLIVALLVEEYIDICESLEFVEFVLEKRQIYENYLELESQVGRISEKRESTS